MSDNPKTLTENDPSVRVGYILTKDGRAWDEEALLAMTDLVNQKFPDENPKSGEGSIFWSSCYLLNDPSILAGLLDLRPDAFIVLSLKDESVLLNGALDTEHTIRDYLMANARDKNATSWGLLSSLYLDIDIDSEERK